MTDRRIRKRSHRAFHKKESLWDLFCLQIFFHKRKGQRSETKQLFVEFL